MANNPNGMTRARVNSIGIMSLVIAGVCGFFAVWSFFQTKDALESAIPNRTGINVIVPWAAAIFVQLGASPLWLVGARMRKSGNDQGATAMNLIGWALTIFDGLTNVLAWQDEQLGGNWANMFRGTIITAIINVGIVLAMCLLVTQAEEFFAEFFGGALDAFGKGDAAAFFRSLSNYDGGIAKAIGLGPQQQKSWTPPQSERKQPPPQTRQWSADPPKPKAAPPPAAPPVDKEDIMARLRSIPGIKFGGDK